MTALVSGVCFVLLASLVLVVAGQPIVTDDAWLHLALGEAYASQGPWLGADPLLANAPGPPTPASWLFDVALVGVQRAAGFTGLRVLHVALVATIIALAWRALRRASGSVAAANVAAALFVVLSAYRLIQLRPHLFTMAAVLLLHRIAFERERVLGARDFVAIAALFAIWANVHAAFLLGPALLALSVVALASATPLFDPPRRRQAWARARSLAVACAIGSAATLVNPAGLRPHLAYFVAGSETPDLGRVADEWTPVSPFSWPPVDLPPSLLSWLVYWGLVVGMLFVLHRAVLDARARVSGARDGGPDPVPLALGVAGIALPLVAVRFLWLGVLPAIAICSTFAAFARARAQAGGPGPARWRSAAAPVSAVLLVPLFVTVGPWPMISSALPSTWSGYRVPYHAGKYHANLVWFIRDAGLRGTAFTDYHMAGFVGYQLSPDVRVLINGTLNVEPEVIAANLPLRLRMGERPGERFADLLDRHGIDLYVGIRLPRIASSARPWFHSTAHLERTDGWIPVFRNLTGAVYLRANERNRENLERVVAYYRSRDVPFDPDHGFDPAMVVSDRRDWAMREGVVPTSFGATAEAAYGSDVRLRRWARDRLASLYATLGLYERAEEIDLATLADDPGASTARRRLVWSLLRSGRVEEAATWVGPLAEAPASDVAAHVVVEGVRRSLDAEGVEERRGIAARLPLFTREEAAGLVSNVLGPPARVRR